MFPHEDEISRCFDDLPECTLPEWALVAMECADKSIQECADRLGLPLHGPGGCVDAAEKRLDGSRDTKGDPSASETVGLNAWAVSFAGVMLQIGDELEDELPELMESPSKEHLFFQRLFNSVRSAEFATQSPASALARKRHAENYAMIDEALKHWREKINPNLSASKAADELLRVVPLSHKKLAEVIAAEKKKRQ